MPEEKEYICLPHALVVDKYRDYVHQDQAQDAVDLMNNVFMSMNIKAFAQYKYCGIQGNKRLYMVYVVVPKHILKEEVISKIESASANLEHTVAKSATNVAKSATPVIESPTNKEQDIEC